MKGNLTLGSVATVIVNWNLKEDTLVCVRSLFAAGAAAGSVIVVDNGSTDGSPGALRETFGEDIVVIETGENLGLSGGINEGLRVALNMRTDWIFLLNNDTVVDPGLFDGFAAAVGQAPEVDVWGPQIFYHGEPERIWFLAEERVLGTLLGRRVNISEKFDPQLVDPVPADYISGCAMLVRREVFHAVGGFDPTFFLFAEEVDFCHRVGAAGFSLAAAPRAKLLHKVSSSTDRDPPRSRYLRVRNQVWFYRRYARGWQKGYLMLFTAFRVSRLFFGSLARGKPAVAFALVRGWFAGWFAPRKALGPGWPQF